MHVVPEHELRLYVKTSQCDDGNKHTEKIQKGKYKKPDLEKTKQSIFKFSILTHKHSDITFSIKHTYIHSHDYDVVYNCCCSYHMLSFSPHLPFFYYTISFTHPSKLSNLYPNTMIGNITVKCQ